MSLVNGWIVPDGEERFDELHGKRASLEHYFAIPHRMLVIRITDVAEKTEPQFLLCTSVRRLETDPSWLVQDLRCRSIDEDTLVVDDKQSAFHVICHAFRIFNAEEFTHWVGADPDILSPTPNSFQTVLRRSAKAS